MLPLRVIVAKPLFILGVGRKVVIMYSDICASPAESIRNDLAAKVAIKEHDEGG
jgi:hypothetical protein